MAMDPNHVFTLDRYIARRKILSILGGTFTIHDPETWEIHAASRQKALKLREDVRVYADVERSEEILLVKARAIIDFSAAYDVTLPGTGELVGTLRR